MAQAIATPVLPYLSHLQPHLQLLQTLSLLSVVRRFHQDRWIEHQMRSCRWVEIPNNKRVEYSLQYIHGIGRTCARQILNDLCFENKLTKDFSKYMIEGDLRCLLFKKSNIPEVLRKEKLYAKFRKCEFWLSRIGFLGPVVTSDGIEADPVKVEAVSNRKVQTTAAEIQSFLGLADYY